VAGRAAHTPAITAATQPLAPTVRNRPFVRQRTTAPDRSETAFSQTMVPGKSPAIHQTTASMAGKTTEYFRWKGSPGRLVMRYSPVAASDRPVTALIPSSWLAPKSAVESDMASTTKEETDGPGKHDLGQTGFQHAHAVYASDT